MSALMLLGVFGLGYPELIVISVLLLMILPWFFYVAALQRILERCAVESRTLRPALVWLMLIPLFNLAWHFVIVSNISHSLHNEFVPRNMPHAEPEPGLGNRRGDEYTLRRQRDPRRRLGWLALLDRLLGEDCGLLSVTR